MEEENTPAGKGRALGGSWHGTAHLDRFPTSSQGIRAGDLLPSAHMGSHPGASPSASRACAASWHRAPRVWHPSLVFPNSPGTSAQVAVVPPGC